MLLSRDIEVIEEMIESLRDLTARAKRNESEVSKLEKRLSEAESEAVQLLTVEGDNRFLAKELAKVRAELAEVSAPISSSRGLPAVRDVVFVRHEDRFWMAHVCSHLSTHTGGIPAFEVIGSPKLFCLDDENKTWWRLANQSTSSATPLRTDPQADGDQKDEFARRGKEIASDLSNNRSPTRLLEIKLGEAEHDISRLKEKLKGKEELVNELRKGLETETDRFLKIVTELRVDNRLPWHPDDAIARVRWLRETVEQHRLRIAELDSKWADELTANGRLAKHLEEALKGKEDHANEVSVLRDANRRLASQLEEKRASLELCNHHARERRE
jgi:chromosome segregation ATPase